MKLRNLGLLAILSFVATSAHAEWSAITKVSQINIGGNGVQGAFIRLIDYSFVGCPATAVALVDTSNVNYKEIMAALLAAKMADRDVRLAYAAGVCRSGYPVITEIILP